jgi:hypothetical protein
LYGEVFFCHRNSSISLVHRPLRADGLVVSNADAEALADAIGRLHEDRALLQRMSGAARDRALRNTKSFWNTYRMQMIRELFDTAAGPN